MLTHDWSDIEEAPKDCFIRVYNGFTGPYISKWNSSKKTWPLHRWNGHEGKWYPRPTLWQPLPDGLVLHHMRDSLYATCNRSLV